MNTEEYDKLSNEEKRIKVAELCGYRDIACRPAPGRIRMEAEDGYVYDIPDYLNDLNACHEFEVAMGDADYLVYVNCHLSQVSEHEKNGRIVSATAEQRCKAFVLTMEPAFCPWCHGIGANSVGVTCPDCGGTGNDK